MSATSGAHLVQKFFPGTGHSYDRCVRVTTLGLDARWKRRLLSKIPRDATAVLDLACGTGIVTFEILRIRPGVRVLGVDITEDYLAVAREKHRRLGGDVEFLHGNAETAPVADRGPFDAVVSCYIPKYVDADRLLANVTPALKPGGVIVLHDFSYPRGIVPRAVWNGYFAVLDPVAKRVFPEWDKVFDASLAGLIRRSRWVTQFREALHRHGYEDVRVERLTFRAATVVSAKRGAPTPPP
jgi:demethylmenaquinone methyltransferase/2-methoxy-6-polyprenyl-1,4-benzoquinol methylase